MNIINREELQEMKQIILIMDKEGIQTDQTENKEMHKALHPRDNRLC